MSRFLEQAIQKVAENCIDLANEVATLKVKVKELEQSRLTSASLSIYGGEEKPCACAASSYKRLITMGSHTHFKAICDNCNGYLILPYFQSTVSDSTPTLGKHP
jgi:formamidopyrimidine-DNA glycosylase